MHTLHAAFLAADATEARLATACGVYNIRLAYTWSSLSLAPLEINTVIIPTTFVNCRLPHIYIHSPLNLHSDVPDKKIC